MTSHLTRIAAQDHVEHLVAQARSARVSRDLRRARKQHRKARPLDLGPALESGPFSSEPLTGVRWGHRLGAAVAR